nr:hypothetical protein CFP56_01845 [Quercus suber]
MTSAVRSTSGMSALFVIGGTRFFSDCINQLTFAIVVRDASVIKLNLPLTEAGVTKFPVRIFLSRGVQDLLDPPPLELKADRPEYHRDQPSFSGYLPFYAQIWWRSRVLHLDPVEISRSSSRSSGDLEFSTQIQCRSRDFRPDLVEISSSPTRSDGDLMNSVIFGANEALFLRVHESISK